MSGRAIGVLAAALALPVSAGPGPNDLVARGAHGVVVTQDPHATQVGLQVLRNGGNAVDAAVAVGLTLAVTHPIPDTILLGPVAESADAAALKAAGR